MITVERRPLGAPAFEPVATVTTDPAGYWTLDGPLDPLASYRATWPAEGGPAATGILDLGADPGRRLRAAAPP